MPPSASLVFRSIAHVQKVRSAAVARIPPSICQHLDSLTCQIVALVRNLAINGRVLQMALLFSVLREFSLLKDFVLHAKRFDRLIQ